MDVVGGDGSIIIGDSLASSLAIDQVGIYGFDYVAICCFKADVFAVVISDVICNRVALLMEGAGIPWPLRRFIPDAGCFA